MKMFLCMMLFGLGVLHAGELAVEKQKFATADKELNKVYQRVKKSIPKGTFAELQADQRNWVHYHRDGMSKWMSRYSEIKFKDVNLNPEYWSLMTSFTKQRIRFLKGWMDVGKEAKWDGEYVDSYGGSITLKQKGDKLHFKIEVVRGPTGHTGEIEGVAEINHNAARYSDEGKEREDGEKTWLDFKLLDGARIKVDGINTLYYHGMRAYFSGTYVRVVAESKGSQN